MNTRLTDLKTKIDAGEVVAIVDMTNTSCGGDSFFTWGDLEEIGYGKTVRTSTPLEESSLSRIYRGPGRVHLYPHGIDMVKGSAFHDE